MFLKKVRVGKEEITKEGEFGVKKESLPDKYDLASRIVETNEEEK